MKLARIYYPWLSSIGALALVGWQFTLAHPELGEQWD